MKTVLLLFGSVKFSVSLIRYMVVEGRRYGWKTCVGSMFDANITESIKHEKFASDVVFINITDYRQCDHAIRKADLVAGILPDTMLLKVADLCIANKKSFITPSKLSRQMLSRKAQIEESGALLLMECGFAPGLDHITAKKAIDNIHTRSGKIFSFRSYHGSMIASPPADNLWEFKLTEPSADVIQTGKQSNRYLYKGKILHIPYHQLFSRGEALSVAGLKNLCVIPEGDALYIKKIYQLQETETVMKGRILRSEFVTLWNLMIKLGLTDSHSRIEMFSQSSFYNFLDSLLPYSEGEHLEHRLKKYAGVTENEIIKLRWLGLFDDDWVTIKEPTPAIVLQHLMEKKFALSPDDKDCILMEHQIEYVVKNIRYNMKATLLAQAENASDPALTKAVGLVTGAAAKAWLLGNIKVKGLHIPVTPEVYDPILNELDDLGVAFHVEETKVYDFAEKLKIGSEKNSNPSSSEMENIKFQKVLTR